MISGRSYKKVTVIKAGQICHRVDRESLSYLSEICARGVGAEEFALDVLLDALYDAVFVQEVHLVFCGMDIHVYVVRSDL